MQIIISSEGGYIGFSGALPPPHTAAAAGVFIRIVDQQVKFFIFLFKYFFLINIHDFSCVATEWWSHGRRHPRSMYTYNTHVFFSKDFGEN